LGWSVRDLVDAIGFHRNLGWSVRDATGFHRNTEVGRYAIWNRLGTSTLLVVLALVKKEHVL
jgi:hypothetical protein